MSFGGFDDSLSPFPRTHTLTLLTLTRSHTAH